MAQNDTAALVVALSAQLTRFEKDMQSAVSVADKNVKKIEDRFAQTNAAITGKLKEIGSAATSQLGFAGSLLSSLGPVGIAAAVGIGAAVAGIVSLTNATAEFAEKAKNLKDGAETAGLTITQFKALGSAGKAVGLDFEETAAFFTKFIANIEALRGGSGPLYDALLKIDVGLARDLASAKDSATAIDILVKAFGRLEDQTKRLDLARAAGGRAGLSGVRLLDSLGRQGGLAGITQNAPNIDDSVEKIVKLQREIEQIRRDTNNIWGKMFASEILEGQRSSAEFWRDIATSIDKIAKVIPGVSSAVGSFVGSDMLTQLATVAASIANPGGVIGRLIGRSIGGAINGGVSAGVSVSGAALPAWLTSAQTGVAGGATKGGADDDKKKSTAAFDLAVLQKNISLLGEAATAAELYEQNQLRVAAALEAGGIRAGVAARAEQAYVLVQRATALAVRERLGIASEQEIVSVRLAQLTQDQIKYDLSDNEVKQAKVIILREAKVAADALTVRQSYLPGLKQLELDAANVRKQLDEVSVSMLNNLSSALTDIATGTVSAKDGFRNLGLQVVKTLTEMIIKMTIIAPLARALQSSLGGVFGIPTGGGGLFGIGPGRASGGPVSDGMIYPVGEQGPELFVPNTAGTIIPNDVLRAGGRGGPVTVNMRIDLTGANGDETIRRIAGSAAAAAARVAVEKANAAVPARMQQYQQLGT